MGRISRANNKLIWTFNGEKMVIEPWGKNSLRVRSTMMGDIQETDYALLPITKAAGAVFRPHKQMRRRDYFHRGRRKL